MRRESSPNDLFRFVQLRPPISLAPDQLIPLDASTDFFKQMQSATTIGERQSIADVYIDTNSENGQFVRSPDQFQHGTAVQNAITTTSDADKPSVDLFVATLLDTLEISNISDLANDPVFQQDRLRLSDSLLARMYSTYLLPNLEALQDLYRTYHLITHVASGETIQLPWDRFLQMSIVIPEDTLTSIVNLRRAVSSLRPGTKATVARQEKSPVDRGPQLYRAYKELMQYDQNQNLIQPESSQVNENGTNVFALTSEAIDRLSGETKQVLKTQGIDPENTPIHDLIMAIYTTLQQEDGYTTPEVDQTNVGLLVARDVQQNEVTSTRRDIHPAGVGNLLVVKQQIKWYEPSEIAHIENILSGESKSREQREFQQVEETFSNVLETTREEQNELQTSQRFELNRETSRTIQQDQNVNFGLNLSGKYGPYVKFSSNFELEKSKSLEETNNNSTNYAQDIVERSLEKIIEHVREERTRRILREIEEKNIHALTNNQAEHIRGVYQFVDKIYEAQVFDYGIRMMYDFMIPEPASYLHFLRDQPDTKLELPEPPPKFTLPSHQYIREFDVGNNKGYGYYASIYSATEIDPPPAPYILTSTIVSNEGGDEEGRPRYAKTANLTIPAGYGPTTVKYSVQGNTDEIMEITVLIGSRFSRIHRHHDVQWTFADFPRSIGLDTGDYSYPEGTQLAVGVHVYESRTFIVDITVFCKRRPETYAQWQLRTFQQIQQAYERRLLAYEEKVAAINAEAALAQAQADEEARFGAPPSLNRVTERNELKKHAIAIVTGSRYDYIDAVKDTDEDNKPVQPYFDFEEAREEGSLIRFFEQAFEWEQMQYVFYPYFWGRPGKWKDRFTIDDPDPQFREFLRAGAARVVVPVRPGFETALQHYLDTGKLWDGQGEPPQITSPLYVSIVDEIKERTGASQGEIPVGEPWDIRVPTNLLYLRANDDLPAWSQNPPGSWQWEPIDSDSSFNQAVTDLVLVDSATGEDIRYLSDGDVLNRGDLPAKITIRAFTNPQHVGSVSFNLNDGKHERIDDAFPYFLYQDNLEAKQYRGMEPKPGEYTLSVTAYTGPGGLGIASNVRNVRFSIKA